MSNDIFVTVFVVVAGIIALAALIFVWRLENGGSKETKEINNPDDDSNTDLNAKS